MLGHTRKRSGFLAFFVLVLFFGVLATEAQSLPDIDQTCASCSRRKNDSLNLQIRKIRLNQVGYLPQDPNKAAMIADPASQQFNIIDVATRQTVFTGTLRSVGQHTEGEMLILSYYNSITMLDSMYRPPANVHLHRADFSAFRTQGRYLMTCGPDTSAHFQIDPKIYNHVFETSLKFFGVNRCGKTDSWIHGPCHQKDGDILGAEFSGALSGGWHDCGDHGKYGATVMYPAFILPFTYALWPEKAEDFYGKSYNDTLPFGTDGIPDVLYEAKIGADYILKLYKASKAKGLIAQADMYHSVGMGPGMDHLTWDVPERQENFPQNRGGSPRPVSTKIGSNTAGAFAAALAFFAWGWEPIDPAYARECLAAAIDIYDNVVMKKRGTSTAMPCCYTGGSGSYQNDEEALAAFSLWYVTKDPRFRFDLLEDPAKGVAPNARFNKDEFPTGMLAARPFYHGGWMTDYENYYTFVIYGMHKLILRDHATAAQYGLSPAVADSLKVTTVANMFRSIKDGSNGNTAVAPGLNADHPYHGVFTSADWGFNRYNMGIVLELFMYWDMTGERIYYDVGIDNLNYNLGMNPWDISFVMGAGEKNLQHPHNRAANPEGLNTGGFPYPYRSPKGALMGGCHPKKKLMDDWKDYTVTETCIDFSAQLVIPTQMLAQDLPPDREGPKFGNVAVFPEEIRALVTWTTDEVSRDSLVLLDAPGGRVLQTLGAADLARNKQVMIEGLTRNTTYWFYFKGMDIRRNATVDNNGGAYWSFTTKTAVEAAQITDVKVCNETHESALVTWWTRNGLYPSQVDYGKTPALGLTQAPDDFGLPTRFHRVTLNDLEPATTYYFDAVSGTTRHTNNGQKHTFKTSEVLVDYTIRIKPTSKASNGASTHFYVDLTNNENEPYFGLELRFYFTADATTAASLVTVGYDNQIFNAAGNPHQLSTGTGIIFGAARPVPGMPDQFYFPVTINDTLPVSGRARFELQINTRGPNNTTGNQPFSFFNQAWSVRPHATPTDPVDFVGVDLTKGATGVYRDPEIVVNVNGKNEISYVENPYITAYYKGVHVYGYGPDHKTTDPLVVRRTASLSLTQPVTSPLDRLDLQQEVGQITLAGTASSLPDGRIDQVIVNGVNLPESELTRSGSSLTFSHRVNLTEGMNVFDIIAWDTANCAVESRKLIVNWIKAPPPPPPQVATPTANPAGSAAKDSIIVALATTTSGATIWYTLNGTDPVPGAAGSTQYTGAIILRNAATLKAIAVRPEWRPSAIMTETYEVTLYDIANVTQAVFRDDNADGYADRIALALAAPAGGINQAVALTQAQGLTLTGGFAASALVPPRITGDTLAIALAPQSLPVFDRRESLTLPAPAAQVDGMLRAGATPIRDGIAPVLRRAILRRAQPGSGSPDTLHVYFSEPVTLPLNSTRPILAQQGTGGLNYGFEVLPQPAALPVAPAPAPGEPVGIRLLVQSLPNLSASGELPVPRSGDSLWINPLAGLTDTVGNAQIHAANVRVPLQILTPFVYTITSVGDKGVAKSGNNPSGLNWVVDAGSQISGAIGTAPYRLPVVSDPNAVSRAGGLALETTRPFFIDLRIHDHLGQYVSRARLQVGVDEFLRLPLGATSESRRIVLLWGGRSDQGNLAGTGVYIHDWSITFYTEDGQTQTVADRKRYGLVRGN